MKRNVIVLGTALTLMMGSMATTSIAPAWAAKGDAKAKKAGKGEKRERPMPAMTADMLGKVLGTPLTDDQKKAVAEANKAYAESVAKAVNLTPAELKAKITEYRKANAGAAKGDGKAKKAQ